VAHPTSLAASGGKIVPAAQLASCSRSSPALATQAMAWRDLSSKIPSVQLAITELASLPPSIHLLTLCRAWACGVLPKRQIPAAALSGFATQVAIFCASPPTCSETHAAASVGLLACLRQSVTMRALFTSGEIASKQAAGSEAPVPVPRQLMIIRCSGGNSFANTIAQFARLRSPQHSFEYL
jgi:hypothetical protein